MDPLRLLAIKTLEKRLLEEKSEEKRDKIARELFDMKYGE